MDIDNPTIKNADGNEVKFDGYLSEVRMFALSITGAVTKAILQANGWAICDGTTPASQGISGATITATPDLRHKFIRMSDDESSGGTVTEDFVPSHHHRILTHNHSEFISVVSTGSQFYDEYSSEGNLYIQDTTTGTAWEGYEMVYFIKVK